MIKPAKFFIFFSAFYFVSFISFCSAEPNLQSSLSRHTLKAGETVTFSFTVEWPSGEGHYSLAIPNLRLKNLTIVNRSESQESLLQNHEPWNRKTFTYELSPEQPGEGRIQEFIVRYINPASSHMGEIRVGPLSVEIPAKRGAQNIPQPVFVLSLAGGGAVALLIFFFLRQRKKQRILINAPEITRQEAAVDKMRQAVQGIEGFNLPNLIRLDREFREYLKDYYGLSLQLSDSEINEQLKRHSLSAEESKKLGRILERLAEAKYMGGSVQDFDFQFLKREIQELTEGKLVIIQH